MTQNAKCIKKIAYLGLKCWESEELAWINSNLREIGEKTLKNYMEFCSRISTSDDFLFEMMIIWSFERVGFNYKVSPKSDVKTHAVSTLIGLKKLLSKVDCNTVQCLIKKGNITQISEEWFKNFKAVHTQKYGQFNSRFEVKNLESFFEFCQEQKLLRDLVRHYKFRNAYYLILKIRGIGDKVAKMIVRDLAFALTDLGKSSTIDCKKYDFYDLSFTIPIDRWVMSLAKSFVDVEENEENCHLSIDIARDCCREGVNPLFFDHGLYYINQDTNDVDCQQYKEKLKGAKCI